MCSWQRETRIRNFGGRLQGEVAYYAPCGKKLRQYPEVIKVHTFHQITYIWCLLCMLMKKSALLSQIKFLDAKYSLYGTNVLNLNRSSIKSIAP